jgi:hypothetical protein
VRGSLPAGSPPPPRVIVATLDVLDVLDVLDALVADA